MYLKLESNKWETENDISCFKKNKSHCLYSFFWIILMVSIEMDSCCSIVFAFVCTGVWNRLTFKEKKTNETGQIWMTINRVKLQRMLVKQWQVLRAFACKIYTNTKTKRRNFVSKELHMDSKENTYQFTVAWPKKLFRAHILYCRNRSTWTVPNDKRNNSNLSCSRIAKSPRGTPTNSCFCFSIFF